MLDAAEIKASPRTFSYEVQNTAAWNAAVERHQAKSLAWHTRNTPNFREKT
jgi:hypothetical protein